MERASTGEGFLKVKDIDKSELQLVQRGLFERPVESFTFDERIIGWIEADPANPINKISKLIDSGSTVLDIGAGNGILPRVLKSSGCDVFIDAIEPDLVAQQYATPYYRDIFKGGLDEYLNTPDYTHKRYDFIVMADVLEHIANPESILKQLKILLKPNGKLIISTPNIAFASVRLALLKGEFNYVDSGILERTHLRFYTRETLLQLFSAIDLHPHSESHCLRNPLRSEIDIVKFSLSPFLLNSLAKDGLASVYQFLYVLQTDPARDFEIETLGVKSYCLPIEYINLKIKSLLSKIYRNIINLF